MKNKDIPLETLALISEKELTKRAIKICKLAKIDSLNKLLEYYDKFGTFLGILTCGQLTNFQLVNLCKLYPNGSDSVSKDILFQITKRQLLNNKKVRSINKISIKKYREEIRAFSEEQNKLISKKNEPTIKTNLIKSKYLNSKDLSNRNISKARNDVVSNNLTNPEQTKKIAEINIIRKIRKELGMTQKQFASAAGFNSVQQISGLENKNRGIGLNLLVKIFKTLTINDFDASIDIVVTINNKKIKIR